MYWKSTSWSNLSLYSRRTKKHLLIAKTKIFVNGTLQKPLSTRMSHSTLTSGFMLSLTSTVNTPNTIFSWFHTNSILKEAWNLTISPAKQHRSCYAKVLCVTIGSSFRKNVSINLKLRIHTLSHILWILSIWFKQIAHQFHTEGGSELNSFSSKTNLWWSHC